MNNEWNKYNKKDGLLDKQFAMIQKNHRDVWLAGKSNFYQLISGKWMPLFSIDAKSDVNVILVEDTDLIWLGTERDGIYRYNAKKVEHFTVDSGLPDNRILDIFKDKDGVLWIVGKSGLARVIED